MRHEKYGVVSTQYSCGRIENLSAKFEYIGELPPNLDKQALRNQIREELSEKVEVQGFGFTKPKKAEKYEHNGKEITIDLNNNIEVKNPLGSEKPIEPGKEVISKEEPGKEVLGKEVVGKVTETVSIHQSGNAESNKDVPSILTSDIITPVSSASEILTPPTEKESKVTILAVDSKDGSLQPLTPESLSSPKIALPSNDLDDKIDQFIKTQNLPPESIKKILEQFVDFLKPHENNKTQKGM
jgi:hypothetical protein